MAAPTILRTSWSRIAGAARALGRLGARGLAALFGAVHWDAPPWWRTTAAALRAGRDRARRHPRQTLGGAVAAVLLAGGAIAAWHWYQTRPQPVRLTVQAGAPERTCYECEPPGTPNPLTLTFGGSAAPLEAVGKTIDAARLGLRLDPAATGTWTWTDDHTLQFKPKADWPVAQDYRVSLPRQGLVAAQVLLADYALRFTAPAFTARIASNEFYQDPVQAGDKKVVTTLEFSHAVDPATLESRISLAQFEDVTPSQQRKVEPAPSFTVTYDKLKLHAYIHTGTLAIPAKGGHISVSIDKGLRAARGGTPTTDKLGADTVIPGRDSLTVARSQLQIVRDERNEPSQALLVETSHSVTEKEMTGHVTGWLLPARHPDPKVQAAWERNAKGRPYPWSEPSQVTPALLAAAQKIELAYVPNERDHVELHSFRFRATPGRRLYLRVEGGLQSFGGYRMPAPRDAVLTVPAYPQELQVAQSGSLLALSGKRKLTLFSRDVAAIRVQMARLLPDQLQHLVSQSYGSLSSPSWQGSGFTAGNITETRTSILTLPALPPGEPHYEALDIGEYLNAGGASHLGVFLLNVQAWDPGRKEVVGGEPDCDDCGYVAQRHDTRLILVTDLGLLVKKAQDGSQDVFVQSIHSGDPVAGVTVEVMGRNGETVLHETTDAAGHVHFPDLSGFHQEKKPVLYLARLGNDMSFLPLDDRARPLDLSRFDVGGISNAASPDSLTAYLFSDRGIYRPGEEIRAAAIVKSQNWRSLPAGLPLLVEITDPRGTTVRRERIKLSAAGFEELKYRTRDSAPAGTYSIALSLIRDADRRDLIGTLDVTVREFLPDRLKMTTHLSAESRDGWVAPDDLKAAVRLENLFGTPAANRRVTAQLRLSPAFPSFQQYRDYQFRDPLAAKEGFNETLPDTSTDDKGLATLPLDLKRFARATYRASLTVQGFEADGGRGVTNEVAQLVSSLPYLVGWKADGSLDFIARGATREARLIAVDPALKSVQVGALTLERIERRYVSMLLKQDNGTFRYESRLKETVLDSRPLTLPAGGMTLALDTGTPGKFSYAVRDAAGQLFARIDYAVAGAANLTRSLDRNAELQITLNKKDYAPGEDIEMQIQAPYTGAGLITIEREKVYAWRWFHTTTTSSMQKIRLPAGALEGNAYVQVTFVRDPASEEIYTSPLSYGIQPFSIALDPRRNALTLDAPELVKPGEALTIRYSSAKPARIALFAVDEGILQVAGYHTPDPLGHFFQKRAHAVQTRQILDLILPEFRDSMLAAPGGDEGGAIGRHLNPFRRRTDPPVAWWSGIVEADAKTRELRYVVPDSFNGRLRVMAVAVAADSIGTAERDATVRGDFVLSPNAPLTVAPGDEFDVSIGVANNVRGSGKDARVTVQLQPSAGLEVLGARSVTLPVAELAEGAAHFRLRARDEPGGASLAFTSSLDSHAGHATATLSIRPATPYATVLHTGRLKDSATVPLTRELYPQLRTQRASIAQLPLALAHGLSSYLEKYPYSCTEQIVSQALPALVLGDRPEFGYLRKPDADALGGLVDELRLRQAPDGGYRYWAGGVEVVDYASVYAQALLLEAAERGRAVPADLIESGNRYLRTIARRDGNSLAEERTTAFAAWLLARQGMVVSNEIAALQKRLAARYAKTWPTDITAAYVAAAYALMKQQELADRTLAPLLGKGVSPGEDRWGDVMTNDAQLLYIVSRHFADRLPRLPDTLLSGLVERVGRGEYQSLSAAMTVLALDAYARALGPRAPGTLAVSALLAGKTLQPLALPAGLFPRVDYPPTSTALKFDNHGDTPAFYVVEESGFDRRPPPARAQGLEVIREYLSAAGQPVTSAKVGEELTVRVRFRAIGQATLDDIVLVDLLPGGFDLAMPPARSGAGPRQAAAPTDTARQPADADAASDDNEAEDSEGGGAADAPAGNDATCGCLFLWSRPAQFPDYADLREDRVVLYGAAGTSLQEFTYHIKATNAGSFQAPPAYGESLYQSGIRATSAAARITVTPP